MKDNKKIVSIIVPVYNMEQTVTKCLDSIIQQDYKFLEVVLINDGSKDGTNNICNEYASKYSIIKYISRENRGLALTLKEGVEFSTGDFIMFVDSDDYIDHRMIETLVSVQKASNADIVQSGVSYVRVDGTKRGQMKMHNRRLENTDDILNAYFIERSMNVTLAGALFGRELFNDVVFPPSARSIDLQVMPFVLAKCHTLEQIEDVFYTAVQYTNSVSRGDFTISMYEDVINCNTIYASFFEQYAPSLKDYMFYRKSFEAARLYAKIKNCKTIIPERNRIVKELLTMFKENYSLLKESCMYKKIAKKERVKLCIFSINPSLYYYFIKVYGKLVNLHI